MMKFQIFVLLLLNVAALACSSTVPAPINFTYPEGAVAAGAVCLVGSPPAYQLAKGYGNGSNDWVVHLEGGGWCFNDSDCSFRIDTGMGGGHKTLLNKSYGGILSSNQDNNPYFYNWNLVYVRYCDGASFMADVEEPRKFGDRTLYFRGARIFKVIVEDLLQKGMKNATNILFSGTSAGALANLLNCDRFRSLVPNSVSRVKCLADSGYFIHGKDLPEPEIREGPFSSVVQTHGLAKQLPKSCTSKMDPYLCLFPENFVEDIQTPLFIVNSVYDQYQIQYRTKLEMPVADWSSCYINISNCPPAEVEAMRDFATTLGEALPRSSLSRGLFVDSCAIHVYILGDLWHNIQGPTLRNKTIAQAVADWFFDTSSFQVIQKADFPYRCPPVLPTTQFNG